MMRIWWSNPIQPTLSSDQVTVIFVHRATGVDKSGLDWDLGYIPECNCIALKRVVYLTLRSDSSIRQASDDSDRPYFSYHLSQHATGRTISHQSSLDRTGSLIDLLDKLYDWPTLFNQSFCQWATVVAIDTTLRTITRQASQSLQHLSGDIILEKNIYSVSSYILHEASST